MGTLVLERKQLKKGYQYTIKDGDKVIDSRKSSRVYVVASVYYHPDSPGEYLRPLYHSRVDLVGKGDGARYTKYGYRYKFTTLVIEKH